MFRLWCWLFGHRWLWTPQWAVNGVKFAMYCEKCGKTAMHVQQPEGPAG